MKNTLKIIMYVSALCTFCFNTVPLHTAGAPGPAPAAGGAPVEGPAPVPAPAPRTVYDTIRHYTPHAVIAASLASIPYSPVMGSIGMLAGSAYLGVKSNSTAERVIGITGATAAGGVMGFTFLAYLLLYKALGFQTRRFYQGH